MTDPMNAPERREEEKTGKRASDPAQAHDPAATLWRLHTVLNHVPISRAGWLAGVKEGRYPPAVRVSPRCIAWRATDIRALVASFPPAT
jgi:predicted DNA-binding transcriptional regulator AlpA